LEAVLRQGFPAERPDEIPPSVKLPVPGGRQEEGHGDLRRAKRIRAYWVAVIILVSLLALFLLSTSGGPTSRAASTSAWNAFRSSSLGFSIEYPAGWVYEVDEGNSQVIFASSSRALQAQGALDSGAAMVVLRIALAQDDFPDSVDAHLPESLLPYFVEYYLGDAYRKESLRKLRVNSYPAATAVYATGRDELDVDQMYHWTVVMDGEMATMMIGLTPEESWYSYKPVFEGMRDSLVP
jgi:hypothetical protein